MNQADILKLAVSAGYDPATLNLKRDTRLVRFAELVAQHEREACIKTLRTDIKLDPNNLSGLCQLQICVEAIRNRKDNHEQ